MINEIVNFINDLPPEVFSYNSTLPEGLYIFIEVDENGNLTNIDEGGNIVSADIGVYKKGKDGNEFFHRCLLIRENVKPVSPQKIFNPNKKIFNASCSPFALCFNKKNYKYEDDIIKQEIKQYFKSASKFVIEAKHRKWFDSFKLFCIENLISFLKSCSEYQSAKGDLSVNIFLKEPSIEDYSQVYESYLQMSVFNKDEYNKSLGDKVYGISDSLSSFSDKKMFWKHKTAPFEYNFRIAGNEAKAVWQFFNLKSRILPNPFPIFIDKKELNEKVIEIFHEDTKLNYSQILRQIFTDNPRDLYNYYLLFFRGREIADMDYVSAFRYVIEDIKIAEPFKLGGRQEAVKIENIFHFEKEIANRIFNGQLIQDTKNGLRLKYFEDIEYNPKYLTANTYNQLLRYRKAFYDYIYKSQQQAITKIMFDDIMIKGILDDIHLDVYKDNQHTKGYVIKEKLNIWFSLFNYFTDTQNQNQVDMINQTELLLNRLKQIAKGGSDERIRTNEEFAFGSGQIIWFLLNKSEASNKTHALLEPFLQKTDANLFKAAIAHTLRTYMHAITSYPNKYEFDKIMGEVMGFSTDKNIKDLLPFILAGYFSESLFKK
jgi:CRISPR-associated protein Csh1